jgi:nucleoside-diphosphate-sugar epimerase
MGTFLVTGGAGFIGSSIAEELLSKGVAARVLFGYEPLVKVKEGLAKTYAAFKAFTR